MRKGMNLLSIFVLMFCSLIFCIHLMNVRTVMKGAFRFMSKKFSNKQYVIK